MQPPGRISPLFPLVCIIYLLATLYPIVEIIRRKRAKRPVRWTVFLPWFFIALSCLCLYALEGGFNQ